MALEVEIGSVVAGAESYVSVADADTYHLNHSNTAWGAVTDSALKEAALRKAARYLDGKYRARWKGFRVQPITQPLEWPRDGVETPGGFSASGFYYYDIGYSGALFYPYDSIPQRLKDAQCELALRALTADLAADADGSIKREKLDVIETEYRDGVLPGQIVYQVVDQLLSDFLTPLGSTELLRG